jgi:hypothetical protein
LDDNALKVVTCKILAIVSEHDFDKKDVFYEGGSKALLKKMRKILPGFPEHLFVKMVSMLLDNIQTFQVYCLRKTAFYVQNERLQPLTPEPVEPLPPPYQN